MHSVLLEKAFHLDPSLLEVELWLTDLLLRVANDRCSSGALHRWRRRATESSLPVAEVTLVMRRVLPESGSRLWLSGGRVCALALLLAAKCVGAGA